LSSSSRLARRGTLGRVALGAVVSLVAVLVAACGAGGTPRQPAPTVRADRNAVVGPGRPVSIGDGRTLYLLCQGSGSPTVILEAGFGGTSDEWSEVQPALAQRTRTCAYDRAGLGYSPSIPGVHDAADEIADLGRLLHRAGIRPPYVLVGHSYGGLLVRLFAHAHPEQTAGIVLVDAMGHDQDRRLLRVWLAQPASVRRQIPRPTTNPIDSGVNVAAGEALDAKVRGLGDTPLIVITRGRLEENGSGTLFAAPFRRPAAQLWLTMQDELAALSPDSVHVIALRSGHVIPLSSGGQPDVVITAVLAVIHAARTHTHLPLCPRVFHSSGVQCRN
jgi:pimeloyl-ACP methyl ester carboxylesterase